MVSNKCWRYFHLWGSHDSRFTIKMTNHPQKTLKNKISSILHDKSCVNNIRKALIGEGGWMMERWARLGCGAQNICQVDSQMALNTRPKPTTPPFSDHTTEMSNVPPVWICGGFRIEQSCILTRQHRRGHQKQDDTSWISNGTLLFSTSHFTLPGMNYL